MLVRIASCCVNVAYSWVLNLLFSYCKTIDYMKNYRLVSRLPKYIFVSFFTFLSFYLWAMSKPWIEKFVVIPFVSLLACVQEGKNLSIFRCFFYYYWKIYCFCTMTPGYASQSDDGFVKSFEMVIWVNSFGWNSS